MSQTHQSTRFAKVNAYLGQRPAILAVAGALAAAVAAYAGLRAVSPTRRRAPKEQAARRATLTKRLTPLLGALKSYYQAQGKLDYSTDLHLGDADALASMSPEKYTRLVTTVLKLTDELSAGALEAYGHDDNEIKKFGLAAEALGIQHRPLSASPAPAFGHAKEPGQAAHPEKTAPLPGITYDRRGAHVGATDMPPPAAPHGSGVGS
ncbi:hypothetical protein GCM10023185_41250 [Hymenobacter saemangeumensis]|uniref:Uncharacterized protein n=1 Tax=Hymenobacter saemangeumensis TaxID=1084522 RepID=A0ABP8IRA4_9BACT